MLKRKIKTDAEFKNIYNEYIQMLEQLKPHFNEIVHTKRKNTEGEWWKSWTEREWWKSWSVNKTYGDCLCAISWSPCVWKRSWGRLRLHFVIKKSCIRKNKKLVVKKQKSQKFFYGKQKIFNGSPISRI